MIVTEFYRTRKDGVRLFLTMDAVVDENGNLVRDKKGNLIPTGFKILQVQTNRPYNKAVDVEGSPYTYVNTGLPVDTRKRRKKENGIQ